jgi:uncharacterized protein YdbL (DUF1318 family)
MVAVMGCARVRVEAPKEPIKVDISMRLDVYQHVEKDINDIESIVTGAPKPQSRIDQNVFSFFITDAFAEGGLSPEIEAAALRRRDRRAELISWEQQGVIGENRSGLVEVRAAEQAASVQSLVQAENSDRTIIYEGVAAQNGTSVGEVQKMYAKRLQADAPSGTPIEVDGAWQVKP